MDLLQYLILPQPGGHVPHVPLAPKAVQGAVPVEQRDGSPSDLTSQPLRSLAACDIPEPSDQVSTTGRSPAAQTNIEHKAQPGTNSDIFEKLSIAIASPASQSPVHLTDKPSPVCAFWLHFGSCRNDPHSLDYAGSGKICNFLHHISPGMQNITVQKVPWTWHKNPCGIDLCPQKDGKAGKGMHPSGASGKSAGGWDNNNATPVVNTEHASSIKMETVAAGKPRGHPAQAEAKTKQKKKKKKKKRKRGSKATTLAVPSVGIVASTPHAQLGEINAPTKKKMRKPRSKGKRAEPLFTPPKQKVMPPKAAQANAKETCFFWYHGNACKRGSDCPMLHSLTNPPSVVQPPPDYMHYAPCGLDWCPGDVRHEHEQMHHRSSTKRMCLGEGVRGKDDLEEGEVPGPDYATGHYEQGWFLSSFPEA